MKLGDINIRNEDARRVLHYDCLAIFEKTMMVKLSPNTSEH